MVRKDQCTGHIPLLRRPCTGHSFWSKKSCPFDSPGQPASCRHSSTLLLPGWREGTVVARRLPGGWQPAWALPPMTFPSPCGAACCGRPGPTTPACRGTPVMSQPMALRSDILHHGSWRTFSSCAPHAGLRRPLRCGKDAQGEASAAEACMQSREPGVGGLCPRWGVGYCPRVARGGREPGGVVMVGRQGFAALRTHTPFITNTLECLLYCLW